MSNTMYIQFHFHVTFLLPQICGFYADSEKDIFDNIFNFPILGKLSRRMLILSFSVLQQEIHVTI